MCYAGKGAFEANTEDNWRVGDTGQVPSGEEAPMTCLGR